MDAMNEKLDFILSSLEVKLTCGDSAIVALTETVRDYAHVYLEIEPPMSCNSLAALLVVVLNNDLEKARGELQKLNYNDLQNLAGSCEILARLAKEAFFDMK